MGLTLGALATAFTRYMWAHAAEGGWGAFPALFPAIAVLGFALVLLPGHLTERYHRGEDPTAIRGVRALTLRWWAVLGVAILVGLLNLSMFPRP